MQPGERRHANVDVDPRLIGAQIRVAVDDMGDDRGGIGIRNRRSGAPLGARRRRREREEDRDQRDARAQEGRDARPLRCIGECLGLIRLRIEFADRQREDAVEPARRQGGPGPIVFRLDDDRAAVFPQASQGGDQGGHHGRGEERPRQDDAQARRDRRPAQHSVGRRGDRAAGFVIVSPQSKFGHVVHHSSDACKYLHQSTR